MDQITSIQPPFPQSDQLVPDLDALLTTPANTWSALRLPSQPRITLSPAPQLWNYLASEFLAAPLEQLAPHLWLMSTQSSANISPLHRQRVKRREIVLTEDPRLHLVWHDERIFIKPLPPYLLSAAFWERVLSPESSSPPPRPSNRDEHDLARRHHLTARAALGFLRTYTHLIRHLSDFEIAQSTHLIPSHPSLTYTSFSTLIQHLTRIPDAAVSPRYAYGELRLSRLNVYAKIFLKRWYYFRLHPQYGNYLAQFYAPILFVFGVLSVALGAMQVETATEGLFGDGGGDLWVAFWHFSRWFSVLSLAFVAAVAAVLVLLLVWRLWAEWSFAVRERWRRRRGERRKMRKGEDDEEERLAKEV
ncbi:hypothetical protein IWZ03DRAFT_319781 [Phyllosticta citriasiana]|uniref:Subtilisin-like serine protease protein n=1 Tax=Phyllosticta citriasiana TaxID=595635 RepID=A0ABR1K884_9PEZI